MQNRARKNKTGKHWCISYWRCFMRDEHLRIHTNMFFRWENV